MKYAHVLDYVARTPWAILEAKLHDLLAVLAFRAAGGFFSAEEIRARLGDPAPSADSGRRGTVAVIPLRGIIAARMGSMEESSGGASAERFAAMVTAAARDETIDAILLDVDSVGGTVPGVPEAADAVWQARQLKPVVALANAAMASAAYWIASQAEELVAVPGALERTIGGIGVFAVHQDLTKALENEGVKITLIRAAIGPRKVDGNPFEPLTAEARADLQAAVDVAGERFLKAVARGRDLTPAQVRDRYGEGRALTGPEAKAAGVIDRIATREETLTRLLSRTPRRSAMTRATGDRRALL